MKWMRSSNTVFLIAIVALLLFAIPALAQDSQPTDRPFPVRATATPEAQTTPTDRPFPGQAQSAATATDRPFPGQVQSAPATATTAPVTPESTEELDATPELSVDDALATASAAQAEVGRLQERVTSLSTELEAAQSDNGATLFALVIIGIGVLLALAVFFGLRRSG